MNKAIITAITATFATILVELLGALIVNLVWNIVMPLQWMISYPETFAIFVMIYMPVTLAIMMSKIEWHKIW